MEQAVDADLITVGKHGAHIAEELLLGSVTKHVLAESQCDVLVITTRARRWNLHRDRSGAHLGGRIVGGGGRRGILKSIPLVQPVISANRRALLRRPGGLRYLRP